MEDQRIIDEYHRLKSCRAVSELLGCSEETIRRVLIANNIPRTHWKPEPQKKIYPRKPKPYKAVKYDPRKCKYCGIEFEPHRKTNVFCSKKCKDLASLKRRGVKHNPNTEPYHKVCKVCGKPFDSFREAQVTCSPECAEIIHPKSKGIKKIEPVGAWVNRLHGNEFDFVEWKSKKRALLRCKTCGNVIERAQSTIRAKGIECEFCKEQKRLQEARRKMACFFNALAQARTPKICAACGGEFFSPYSNQKYCSSRCKHKGQVRKGSYRARCRKYGVFYDPSVNRTAVIKRDGGVCQICGKMCDPNDHRWGSSGPDYPTLDHIIALANGGTHTWGNVQCACGMCNSKKRDLPWEDVEQWVV